MYPSLALLATWFMHKAPFSFAEIYVSLSPIGYESNALL